MEDLATELAGYDVLLTIDQGIPYQQPSGKHSSNKTFTQSFHAILARSESFASSSAWTAISRETVGNCRRNSFREWPPSR
jgi:hypothetical protein